MLNVGTIPVKDFNSLPPLSAPACLERGNQVGAQSSTTMTQYVIPFGAMQPLCS